MAEVYRARDNTLYRDVAIKVLHQETAEEASAGEQLLREARLACALSHPNICTVFEVNTNHEPPFIVMEFVSGKTLAEVATVGALTSDKVLSFGLQIADALEHAHSHGVIHRDLKSANVMVGAGDRLKVLDFGLAKRLRAVDLNAPTATEASLTEHGAIVGTLQYMSPEVLRGGIATEASDIWAVGVMLHEMLSGKLPFRGESAYDLTTAIMRDPPGALPAGVSSALNAVVQRCLSKDPGQRYASGGELRAALQAIAAGAQTATPQVQPVRPAWQRRFALLASAFVLAVVVLWLTWHLLPQHAGRPDSIAVLPFSDIGSDQEAEYFSDGLTGGLIDGVSRLPNLKVISRSSAFHYKGKTVDPRQVGRELGVKSVLVGTLALRNDQLTVDAELIDTSDLRRLWGAHYTRPFAESASLERDITRDIEEQIAGTKGANEALPANTGAESNEAYQNYLKARYHLDRGTPEEVGLALPFLEKAAAADPSYALAYSGLAEYYFVLADLGVAAGSDVLPKAKAAAEKALKLDPGNLRAANILAYVKMSYDWDLQGAEHDFQRIIAAQPSDPVFTDLHAICLRALGRGPDAIAAARGSVKLDPLAPQSSTSLAWNLFYFRHWDEAVAQFRDTLLLDPNHVTAHFGLALAYDQKGDQANAADEFA
jgi:serine/threonine-protein kinase